MEETFGWRHFQVIEKRKKGDQIFALMAATCDESTRFWVRNEAKAFFRLSARSMFKS